MSTPAIAAHRPTWAWLREPRFDIAFILGLPAMALLTGVVVLAQPSLFPVVLLFDLWVLGYHHVISTYTRLLFDAKSRAEHRDLIVSLPLAVALATILAVAVFGLWIVVSVYFYWQWFHYTRQSWGISRAYRAKDRDALFEDGWLDTAIFYALPVAGIVHRSAQGAETFLGLPLRSIPIPAVVDQAVLAGAIGLMLVWLVRRVQALREGRLANAHTLYMLSHFTMFAVGYLVIADISYGWLTINIWHNAQYILFVWMFNTRRFKDGVDAESPVLSWLCQPGRLGLYLAFCLVLTGVLYWGVIGTIDGLLFTGLAGTVVLFQILNFHHYVVDSRIWKVRAAPIRATLGIRD